MEVSSMNAVNGTISMCQHDSIYIYHIQFIVECLNAQQEGKQLERYSHTHPQLQEQAYISMDTRKFIKFRLCYYVLTIEVDSTKLA